VRCFVHLFTTREKVLFAINEPVPYRKSVKQRAEAASIGFATYMLDWY
jgi:hypothetical protein